MPGIVEVDDLVKEFRTFDRREGVFGAIKDLFTRRYRTLRAVDRISFEIRPGEMVGYIGPNGAGKSTTIKMLTGILVPSAGAVFANGFTPWKHRSEYAKTIGVVFGQRTQLWWDIAVVESFRLLKKIYQVSDSDYKARMKHFDEVLELGQYLHTPVRKLSLGQRMRCDVAAAMIHNPPLVFLDEPTIGLDIVAKENIRVFLRETNRKFGTTMLLTTHDLTDIEQLCARLMIIDHGRLLFDGRLGELKDKLWSEQSLRLELKDPDQVPAMEALDIPDVTREQEDELTFRLHFPRDAWSTAEVIRQVVTAIEVRDIAIEEQPIDEVVRRIYLGEMLAEDPDAEAQKPQRSRG